MSTWRRIHHSRWSLALLLALGVWLHNPTATRVFAATIVVGCDASELANAIITANNNGEADVLVLASDCTYSLTSANQVDPDGYGPVGLPPITSTITIQGNGATIRRDSGAFRLFYVSTGGDLTLENLTLSNGYAQGFNGGDGTGGGGGGGSAGMGGAIFNRGALTIRQSALNGHTATGGGITTNGTAPGGGGGGGLGGNGVTNGTGNGGNGGGINGGLGGTGTAGAPGNPGGEGGGGGGGTRNLNGVGGVGGAGGFGGGNGSNGSGSPSYAGGSGGSGAGMGGALFNYAGTVHIINTTLSGNTAQGGSGAQGYGGALFNYEGTVVITNTTFSSNTVTTEGGAVYNYQGSASAALTMTNVILANTTDSDTDCYNRGGTVNGLNTLIETNPGGGNACGTPTVAGDPLLGSLAGNGGGTLTHALLPASPVVDMGDPATCPATDQRGEPRADLRCDIGAFELQHADSDTVIKPGMAAGAQASFGPTFISVTVTSGDAGTIIAAKHLTPPGGVHNTGEITATWYLTASGSSFSVTLGLCYTEAEIAGLNTASLRAYRWDTDLLTPTWTVPISTGLAVTDNCIILTGIEAFSAWTLKDVSLGASAPTVVAVREIVARGGVWSGGVLLAAGAGLVVLRRRRQRSSSAVSRHS